MLPEGGQFAAQPGVVGQAMVLHLQIVAAGERVAVTLGGGPSCPPLPP